MFIDLHCHTKNSKKSETTREVDASTFLKTMKGFGVGIVGITNHNLFDHAQFETFADLDKDIQVWPGIELDVVGNKSGRNCRGHVILISNPKQSYNFDAVMKDILKTYGNNDPDSFVITIDNLVNEIKRIDECLIICHYKKDPELSVGDIEFLKSSIDDKKLVMLEPSNARKASIVVYQDNEQSWFGSDVKDWEHYPNEKPGFELPKISFKIDSFEKFFFLLKKNRGAVLQNGYLDPKKSCLIPIKLFGDLSFDYQIFNDVNVIFGGKATAKTSVLRAVEDYFNKESKIVSHFYVEDKENTLKNIVSKKPTEEFIDSFSKYGCEDEINKIKEWKWSGLHCLSDFYRSEVSSQHSLLTKRLGITKSRFSEVLDKRSLDQESSRYRNDLQTIDDFEKVSKKGYLTNEELNLLNSLIGKMRNVISDRFLNINTDYYSKSLEKWSIEKIKIRIAAADAAVPKPSSVGFVDFFRDYSDVCRYKELLLECLQKEQSTEPVQIGSIPLKGIVYRKTFLGFKPQNPSKHKTKTGGDRIYINNQTKTHYDDFFKAVKAIDTSHSSEEIALSIQDLKNKISELKLSSLTDFLNYSNFLVTDNSDDFLPSNGVTSILLVDSALSDEKADVYILDEPDGGMGADFINEDLIPEILRKSGENKIVVIATHDPNIVVRTHPYSCVYREEVENNVYKTYVGSSFDDELVNVDNPLDTMQFANACLDKCEGGDKAFVERMVTYGKE